MAWRLLAVALGVGVSCFGFARADETDHPESLWLEAEHFSGIQGHCWPMGDDLRNMRQAVGHWGLAGPGWAAEWNQGGESGFLSIAVGPDETQAVAMRELVIPRSGRYRLWVRYGDWREVSEQFEVQVQQPGANEHAWTFGGVAKSEEDNEMKLYWGWSFVWDFTEFELVEGNTTVTLRVNAAQPAPRQIDVLVLTTDTTYRPLIKEQPRSSTRELLESMRHGGMSDWRPLARRNLWREIGSDTANSTAAAQHWALPVAWRTKTFADRGFLYLWNVSHTDPLTTWLSDDPNRVRYPYNLIDPETRTEFETMYGGKEEVPIFSDPRVTPTFHTVGAGVFETDPATGAVKPLGEQLARWLDSHPDRMWGTMMNYHPGVKVGAAGVAMFEKYRDRYVGSVAGESLGYFYPDESEMLAATANAQNRRELVEAFSNLSLRVNAEKYRTVYDRDLDPNPYADVISCHSTGSLPFTPICFDWGAKTVGYESSAATASLLGLRWACMRGTARQFDGLTATYRSCNFGDSATIFSKASSYTGPENILDNYYSVYSGAGMTWYKFDIWYQYMAGSSMFYHEQGFDEFWKPGGTTAAGRRPVQLSPKGKLVDRFLRVTRQHPQRGSTVTPIAFLMDYAHGWEPTTFWPNSFVNWHRLADRFRYGNHEAMLQQWLWAAYHPIVAESEKPMTGINEVFVPGMFGDIFDCIFAFPQIEKWRTIDLYPVTIVLGEIELTAAEGERLAQYVQRGGTLVVSANQLSGPGVDFLQLPFTAEKKGGEGYVWVESNPESSAISCERFQYQAIDAATVESDSSDGGWQSIAVTLTGETFCAWADRGEGRIVALGVPLGLTVSQSLHPVAARLLGHLTRDQMPIEVDGDVQWMVNRGDDCWYVTLLNPAGQAKPQQGITPTDYRQNRQVTIRGEFPFQSAIDWLSPDETLAIDDSVSNELKVNVFAGGVRVIEIR